MNARSSSTPGSGSTSSTSAQNLTRVVERVNRYLPADTWTPWPGGWPGEIEAALLDAVFSIRAAYGSPTSGVRAVVGRWRQHRGGGQIDDLRKLAAFHDHPDDLTELLKNHQKTARRPKSHVVAELAHRFTTRNGIQVVHAGDLPAADAVDDLKSLEQEWKRTPGLGPVTWAYFTMLLGRYDVKADVMIRRFLSETLERPIDVAQARALVHAAADRLSTDPTTLDHAIWSHQRNRRRRAQVES